MTVRLFAFVNFLDDIPTRSMIPDVLSDQASCIQPPNKNALVESYVAVRDRTMVAFWGCAKNSNIETEFKHTGFQVNS